VTTLGSVGLDLGSHGIDLGLDTYALGLATCWPRIVRPMPVLAASSCSSSCHLKLLRRRRQLSESSLLTEKPNRTRMTDSMLETLVLLRCNNGM